MVYFFANQSILNKKALIKLKLLYKINVREKFQSAHAQRGCTMWSLFMNCSLKLKMTIINFVVVFVVILLLGIFFYFAYYNNVISEAKAYQRQNTEIVKEGIEDIQNNLVNLSSSLLYSPYFQAAISSVGTAKNADDATTLVNFQINSIVNNNYVSYFSIYAKNGYRFNYARNGLTAPPSLEVVEGSVPYKQTIDKLGQPLWINIPQGNSNFLLQNSASKISLLRSIIDIDSKQSQGIMVTCINWNSIWSSISNVESTGYFVVDDDGTIVTGSTEVGAMGKYGEGDAFPIKSLSDDTNIVTVAGQNYLLTSRMIYQSGLRLVSVRPLSEMIRNLDGFRLLFVVIVAFCLFLSLLLSGLASSFVTNPLRKLVLAINRAGQGDLKQHVNFLYRDEIGVLGMEFNKMADELNTLINTVLKLEIKNHEAELKALIEQINPHFLYNTLDSIYIKALKAKDVETAEMVFALAQMFRLTLNHGNAITTVKNETEFIQSYVFLQKIRYKDRLRFSMCIDEPILPLKIPKLILQPFVENCIVHAAESSAKATSITVEGSLVDGNICFTIADDGTGMEQETLENLLAGKGGGYAISNIKERLNLLYGASYQLSITSDPGGGTVVTICIPVRRTEEDVHV